VALAADSFLFSWRKRHAPKRAAFNAVAPALSMWVAAQVFFMLSGTPPLASGAVGSIPDLVLPLLCLAAIYFLLNSGLMAVAVGLESGQPAIQTWRRHFLWLSLGYWRSFS
jgi:hypothetical protein